MEYFSEDPIGFAAGDANLYRYVGNSPTNAADPSGLAPPEELEAWRQELREAAEQALRDAAAQQQSEPHITRVPGVLGNSVHLNDGYFAGSPFGIPTIVCHGVTGIGRVGPPNSFRFPGGAGQLQYYQALRDTTTITGVIAGAGTVATVFAPPMLGATATGSQVAVVAEGQSAIGWVMNGRVVVQSLPVTSHAALGAQAGLVCEGQAVAGASAFTVIKEGGKLFVLGSRNFGGTLVVSEATRRAVLEFFK